MTSIPLFFSNGDDTIDLVIGKTNVSSYKDLPVPFPKELESEFTSLTNVRNVEVFRTNQFRIKNYDGTNHVVVNSDGDTTLHRYLQVNGNQIKSSTGQTAIQLTGQNVKINGQLEVDGAVQLDNTLRVQNTAEFFSNILGYGNINASGNITATGTITGSAKFFDIPHPDPAKPNHRLVHGALEGPELAVYIRGKCKVAPRATETIFYPEYWEHLVDPQSITVHISAVDSASKYYVDQYNEYVQITSEDPFYNTHLTYLIMATRRDVSPLITEYETN